MQLRSCVDRDRLAAGERKLEDLAVLIEEKRRTIAGPVRSLEM